MSYIGKGVETVTFNTATTLDVAGNITLGGTVDGRDVATDGTKLDTITSGAIADILQDTTPQLGGNLDLNTSNVIGTGNINVTGSITGTSFVSTGNMSFTNNSKAIFGTSPSLEIYHDGSNSILDDVGAGNFKMQLAGADKLEITSTGVDVTGTVTADGLAVDGDGLLYSASNVEMRGNANVRISLGTAGTSGANNNSNWIYGNGNNLRFNNAGGFYSWETLGTERMRIDASGNVGIGTAPESFAKLEVKTATDRNIAIFDNAAGPTISAITDAGASQALRIAGQTIIMTGAGGSGAEHMRIDSSGNVGIGGSPTSKLSVVSGTNAGITVNDGTVNTILFNTSSANGSVGTTTNHPMAFYSNNAERMRIDTSGNVGIGAIPETTYVQKTTLRLSSTASLIAGTSYYPYPYYIANNLNYDASDNLKYIANSGGALLSVNAHTGGSFSFYTAPTGTAGTTASLTERFTITTNGFLECVGVYTQSAADSANVVVDASGNIYRSTSALKYKQDIRDIEEIDINQFRPIRYKSNLNRDDQTKDHFGFIADEAHDAGYTELVSYGAVNEETGIAEVEGFRYDRMTVLLTKVVQQQQETITSQQAIITSLEARIAALENT